MKKLLIAAMLVAMSLTGTVYTSESVPVQVAYGHRCPECGCGLTWTGQTDYCVGIRCRTVKIYQCGCCNTLWRIYED